MRVEDGKLVAILGTRFARTTDRGPAERPRRLTEHPRFSLSPGGKWENDGFGAQPDYWDGSGKQCIDAPMDAEAALRSVGEYTKYAGTDLSGFNQMVTSCVSDGYAIWGGVSYYDAESGWGVGGLARQDIESGKVDVLRPHKLVDESTGPVAFFADRLWLGTARFGECWGPPPGKGLKQVTPVQGSGRHMDVEEVPEVCGFGIRDFQEFNGALWVATDLGLSRLAKGSGRKAWTNFVPDPDHADVFRELSCPGLYRELLTSGEFAAIEVPGIGNAFDVFWKRLSTLRPNFARRYIRELHGHPFENYPGGYWQSLP